MVFVQVAYLSEEETVACHRVIRARASQNKSVVATEGRDHDRDRHDGGTGTGKVNVGRSGGDAIVGRIREGIPWQRRWIGQVRGKVEGDDENGSGRKG